MDHRELEDKLEEWLDGEASPSEAAELAAHVVSCASCRERAEALRRLGRGLFPRATPPGPDAFVGRVMARLRSEPEPWERWSPRWLAPALGVALAGLVFALARVGVEPDYGPDPSWLADAVASAEAP